MKALRLVFMGTPEFAVPTFEALVAAGHDVVSVYSQPPRPAGRGQRETRAAVHEAAARHGIPVRTPTSLKDPAEQADFATLGADAAVVMAYGLILPKPVLVAPRLGCLNLHASLLPRWRGAAPLQRAIMAGDRETGLCVMAMDEGLDTGPVLLSEHVEIGPATTGGSLHDALAHLGGPLILKALEGLDAGTLTAKPQPAEGVTYADKLTPDEGRLDWSRPADELERRVRALNPWPSAWFQHDANRIKVHAAEVLAGRTGPPGTILDDRFAVACGRDALRLTRVQRAGRGAMTAEAFLRGYALPPGARLD